MEIGPIPCFLRQPGSSGYSAFLPRHELGQHFAEVAQLDRHRDDDAVVVQLGLLLPVLVALVQQQDGGNGAGVLVFAEVIEGLEGRFAQLAGAEDHAVGRLGSFGKAAQGPLRDRASPARDSRCSSAARE